ncbi:hypothetical protein SAMN05892883_0683 [Jatrophihabitans sp. GAS493]|uniref:hypothetical protein n=1 Tax=Jatrophihabitans sp. GAS493 TaxID=1907575 RepID=UPI000BB97F85|nr:hypothetical protein [Jatrophihabitans sp. GAS493]SOD71093.1 hypothetical protein SAMN05892883_0683 [Jatrophihabitans sp. GAS493]
MGDSIVGSSASSSQARKLGLRPGLRLALINQPAGWSLADPPADLELIESGPVDVILAFFTAAAEVVAGYQVLGTRIRPAGGLWIAWPRRAAGHRSDIDGEVLRELILPSGLVDNKNAAIDEDWSGLRFVWRISLR